jgi:hypothetical protein
MEHVRIIDLVRNVIQQGSIDCMSYPTGYTAQHQISF